VTTLQERLDELYGSRGTPRRRRVLWAVAIVVAVVLVGGYGWFVVTDPSNGVRADGTAFEVRDDRTTSITFQLSAPPGTALTCAIEALDEEHGVVGWRIVEYPASDQHTRPLTESIPTVARATTGLVNSCWVA
jgi:hypothetical protein